MVGEGIGQHQGSSHGENVRDVWLGVIGTLGSIARTDPGKRAEKSTGPHMEAHPIHPWPGVEWDFHWIGVRFSIC